MSSSIAGSGPPPPMPERRRAVLRAHGDERTDDWYWLRDRDDPAVLAHLAAENDYAEAALARLAPLREALYGEFRQRIVETDLSVPVHHGPWWYYVRTVEGSSYPIHCRRPATGDEAPPSPESDDPAEEVLLDENRLAEGHDYLQVANLVVSPDHSWLAYAVDGTGAERYDLRFRRLDAHGPGTGAGPGIAPAVGPGTVDDIEGEIVPDTYYGLAWASDNATVFYTRVDDAMRPHQVWRHRLGSDPADDVLVLHEEDRRFVVEPWRTRDGAYVVLSVRSTTSSEAWVVEGERPESPPRVVLERRPGVEYEVDHWSRPGRTGWLVAVTNEEAEDFRVMAAPDDVLARDAPGPGWSEVVPHRPGTRLLGLDVFDHWAVLSERAGGEACLRVAPLDGETPSGPFGGGLLARSWPIPVAEHPATTWEGPNPDLDPPFLRYEQTSMVTPRTVLDLELATHSPVVRKRQPVRGYRQEAYRSFRLHARADDGTEVPISVVHRCDLVAPDAPAGTPPERPAPCVLYGYGAYEHSVDPAFSPFRVSLLDRGGIFAIAHVRGGGELGRRWYEEGKLGAKEHTFTDFVACARHLVAAGFTAPDRLAARGGSAGGLLVGAAANLAHELFRAMVAEVPFVDCLTTMLDDTLPLTVGEWEEWGNPKADPAAYSTLRAYSPYDNVRARRDDGAPVRYPDVLATAGLNDNRVGFWEPAKWVARLRSANPENRAYLRVELGAGHGGPSGRYDAWRDEALVLAFLLDALGITGGVSPRPG